VVFKIHEAGHGKRSIAERLFKGEAYRPTGYGIIHEIFIIGIVRRIEKILTVFRIWKAIMLILPEIGVSQRNSEINSERWAIYQKARWAVAPVAVTTATPILYKFSHINDGNPVALPQ
jgi:hypothetical protein